jgi:3-phosphoshikimate 1-carboxyvinyltransferase
VAALDTRSIAVPGDKSISHRALLLSALSERESILRDILVSEDVATTAMVLRELGVDVPPLAPTIRVQGRGLRGLSVPGSPLECGNSGTTARLAAGIVAGHPFSAKFVGDKSLSRRPMRRVANPLEAMGARVDLEKGDGLPMTVHGGDLRSIDWTLEVPSAQVKSAILLAGLVGGVGVTVRSARTSRDHTERMLAALGVEVASDNGTVALQPVGDIPALDLTVPGDPSSAAFLVALATLADDADLEVQGVCLNPTRLGFVDVLNRMGAEIRSEMVEVRVGEPVGVLRARSARLRGATVAVDEIPALVDELPLIACVAALARGETRVTGAAELRVKESDRIAAIVSNLRAVGADAEELADGFVVRGSDGPLCGEVITHADHRIAMAFGVLAKLPHNRIEIDDRDCVAISYPSIWTDLDRVLQ